MNLDDELRSAGGRLREHTAVVLPDVDDLRRRSTERRRRSTIVVTLAGFVLVLVAVAGVNLQRGTSDTSVSLFGNGNGAPPPLASVPAASSSTTTTEVKAPPPIGVNAADAIGGGAPCDAATFGAVVRAHRNEPVTSVDRFACINNWAAARVATAGEPAVTYLFHIEGHQWVPVSTDVDADAAALTAVGAPLDSLFRIMGLARPRAATTTSKPAGPLTVVAIDESMRPPSALLALITKQFLADIGDPALHDTIGPAIRVFDGFVLSTTTMREFDDADRDAIAATLVDAGFTVEFIPFVDSSEGELPTLVLADPSIHRDVVTTEPGTFAMYSEISGCGQACGFGADYLGRPDGEGGWIVTPVVDAGEDPPVAPPSTTGPIPEPTIDPTTTITEPPPEGPSGEPTA